MTEYNHDFHNGGTFGPFSTGMKKMGVDTNWVRNPESFGEWKKAITPKLINRPLKLVVNESAHP